MRYYTITVDGRENINAADRFVGQACTRGIYNHGVRLAQVEVVIPFGEQGYTCTTEKGGLVSISYIKPANVGKTLDAMKRIGFSGVAYVAEEEGSDCWVGEVPGSGFCTVI